MRTRSFLAPTALALAAVLGACSDDKPTPEVTEAERPFVQAMADDLVERTGVTTEDAECMAATVVQAYGIESIESASGSAENANFEELPKDEMTLAQAEDLIDDLGDCTDLSDFLADSLDAQGEDAGLSKDDIECLSEAIDDGVIKAVAPSSFTSDYDSNSPESQEAFGKLNEECPDAIANIAASGG
jgi:hypothetical protein